MAYQRLPEYHISFPLFKVSEPWKLQMSSFCVSTDGTHCSKRAIFSHSKQNEKNESYLTQCFIKGFQNINLVSLYSKSVSCENCKCLHFASVQMKHIVQERPFFSFQAEWKKWVIFDTMFYQRLPEYQFSFPLFKVSELWKLQMSPFCISTDEAHSSRKAIFFIPNRMKRMSHIWHNFMPKASRISN